MDLASQIIYGANGDSRPALVGEGKEKQSLTKHDDFLQTTSALELITTQQILQGNAETNRVASVIASQQLDILAGGATLADVIDMVNRQTTIWNNFIANQTGN